MVAVAVMAGKSTTDPMTAVVMTTLMTRTSQAAWMGMCEFLLRRLKYLLPGKIPPREIAYVTLWVDMKQLAVAQVESTQRRERIAVAPLGPTSWTRYAVQLLRRFQI